MCNLLCLAPYGINMGKCGVVVVAGCCCCGSTSFIAAGVAEPLYILAVEWLGGGAWSRQRGVAWFKY